MSRALEELDRLLVEKDSKISELEEKLEHISYNDEWSWRKIRPISEEENLDLPLPRLELRYRSPSAYTRIVDYGLVNRHLTGEIQFIPLGSTKMSGTISHLDIPYRDGGHIFNDMYELKLRGFVVDGTSTRELTFTDNAVPWTVLDRVQKDKP